PGAKPQEACNFPEKEGIDLGQPLLLGCSLVPIANGRSECLEERGPAIGEFKLAPMLLRPGLLDLDLVDRLLVAALADDRNRQPFEAGRGLDTVTIVPVAFHILRPVKYHVTVAPSD